MNANELDQLAKKACGICISGLDPEILVPETNLADVGCDSVSLTEISMEIEDALEKVIPAAQLTNVRTYGDLLKVVQAL